LKIDPFVLAITLSLSSCGSQKNETVTRNPDSTHEVTEEEKSSTETPPAVDDEPYEQRFTTEIKRRPETAFFAKLGKSEPLIFTGIYTLMKKR